MSLRPLSVLPLALLAACAPNVDDAPASGAPVPAVYPQTAGARVVADDDGVAWLPDKGSVLRLFVRPTGKAPVLVSHHASALALGDGGIWYVDNEANELRHRTWAGVERSLPIARGVASITPSGAVVYAVAWQAPAYEQHSISRVSTSDGSSTPVDAAGNVGAAVAASSSGLVAFGAGHEGDQLDLVSNGSSRAIVSSGALGGACGEEIAVVGGEALFSVQSACSDNVESPAIGRVELATGELHLRAAGSYGFAVDENGYYASDNADQARSPIVRFPFDGGAPTVVAQSDDDEVGDFAVNHTTVFWLVWGDNVYDLREAPKP